MIDLKKLRNEKGLTQEQLAEKCNVIRQTISNIECGLSRPSIETAKIFARILDCQWIEFFE